MYVLNSGQFQVLFSCPLVQCDMVSDACHKVGGLQQCVNTDPGFHCLPCPARYKGSQPYGLGVESAKTYKQVKEPSAHRVYSVLHKSYKHC